MARAGSRVCCPTESNHVRPFDDAASEDPHMVPATKHCTNQIGQDSLAFLLNGHLKFSTFRGRQLDVVGAACAGYDIVLSMPPNGGKSVCYALPALIFRGVTIVVCPKERIDAMRSKFPNGTTASWTDGSNSAERTNVSNDLFKEEPVIKMLFVSPVSVIGDQRLKRLVQLLYAKGLLLRFVICHAQFSSSLSYSSKGEYAALAGLRAEYPTVPITAMVPRFMANVVNDIRNKFALDKSQTRVFVQKSGSLNLKLEVRKKDAMPMDEIARLIREKFHRMRGIIYCIDEMDCYDNAEELFALGVPCRPYSAGSPRRTLGDWASGVIDVLCIPFGENFTTTIVDIRFVIHFSMPWSAKDYYREVGLAGKDGKLSVCMVLYTAIDYHTMVGELKCDRRELSAE